MRSDRSIVITLCLALVGCADFKRGEYWEEDEEEAEGADTEGYSYEADVHPLLDSGCERCHGDGGSAATTAFFITPADVESSYMSTLQFVDVADPEGSRLLSKASGNGHGGGTIYDDQSGEYAVILSWIEVGAPP